MIQWWQNLRSKDDGSIRSAAPFFIILTAVLIGLSAWSIMLTPSILTDPLRLGIFIALMIVHIGLHWLSPYMVFATIRANINYMALQSSLALVLILLIGANFLTFALYLALIGESVSIFRQTSLKVIAVSVYMALSALAFILISGRQNFSEWIFTILPTTLFVVTYVVLFVRQAEARSRAQKLAKELEIANQRLADYAERIEQLTLQGERQRMARELHDTLAQGLAGLILQLEAADSHLGAGRDQKAQTIIRQAMERSRSTLAEARQVIDNLRSGTVGPSQMEELIRREVDLFSAASGIKCTLCVEFGGEAPQHLREPIQRCVSEGLTNIARHAHASKVDVKAFSRGDRLVLTINDDGVGFDPQKIAQAAGHYGLLGMRERAHLAGGELNVRSQSGKGTLLTLELPLTEKTS